MTEISGLKSNFTFDGLQSNRVRQGRVAAAAMGSRSGKFLIVLKSERGFDSLYALNIGG